MGDKRVKSLSDGINVGAKGRVRGEEESPKLSLCRLIKDVDKKDD